MNKLTTTLNNIKACRPCEDGWTKLLKHLGKTQADDEPLPYETILDSNGLNDALWCCRCEPKYDREWRLFAVWCARQVQHLMTDKRSIDALDVAERYANGKATDKELKKAKDGALDAWRASTGVAGEAAAWAAGAAARAAAWEAVEAAWEAAWEKQAEQFRKVCRGEG